MMPADFLDLRDVLQHRAQGLICSLPSLDLWNSTDDFAKRATVDWEGALKWQNEKNRLTRK
jgi:hypothetical protein